MKFKFNWAKYILILLILVTNTSEHEQLQSLQNAFLIMCSQRKTSTAFLSTWDTLWSWASSALQPVSPGCPCTLFFSHSKPLALLRDHEFHTQSLPPGAIIHFSSLSRNSSKSISNVTFVIPSLDLPSTVSHFVKLTISLNKRWYINRNASSLLIQNRD